MQENQLCLRLAFVDFDGTKALAAYKKFEHFKEDEKLVTQLVPKLFKATQLICDWFRANC